MEKLRDYIFTKKHHAYRRRVGEVAQEYSRLGLDAAERMCRRFEMLCAAQAPVILAGEMIVYLRTVENIPDCFTEEEWQQIRGEHFIHELGYLSNVTPDYASVIREGLLAHRDRADAYATRQIDAVLALADRYRAEAERCGRTDVAEVLAQVPRYGARSFREALQFFRILHFSLWLEGNYHVTCGRFDQYMMPYLQADLESGRLTQEEAQILLEDFFLSFNKDSDLYVGVQQGDNGQSMVLGGVDREGKDAFNLLSRMCLLASRKLCMIDPKINLRVNAKTPPEIYELGTELTAAGLGFPQYSNDDVVVDGLVALGYSLEDARDYGVAACWEFIIPAYGMDVANIGALSFPAVIDRVLHSGASFADYGAFCEAVKQEIQKSCEEIMAQVDSLWFVPSPLMESMLYPKYYNFGIHGTGIATAADSMAAIRRLVFEEKRVTWENMVQAVDRDFSADAALLHTLRYEMPKMGQGESSADEASVFLLDRFADALADRKNCLGGIWRAGTGSAMFYLRHAAEIGASPDGRRRGEPFGANFSPSLFARVGGPLSVIQSFSRQNFRRAINGGPLTLEFSSSVFDTSDGMKKTAMLVRAFIHSGGHQLQLNAVNAEMLHRAQEDPEAYRGLIVRIWGWSAYFCELDREFQDHVIARQEYTL